MISQFSADSIQSLGCGSTKKLMSDYQDWSSAGVPKGNAISYLHPLIMNSKFLQCEKKRPGEVGGSTPSVGILGNKSRGEAVACLAAAPLLEDLHHWSHWSAIFQPQFGDLSDFLFELDQGSSTSAVVSALEVCPGKLLRVDRASSIQAFNSAVDRLDSVGVSGHLVSLIVLRGNTRDISTQLLSSHVTSVLERVKADGAISVKQDRESFMAKFILDCLLRIPLEICKLVAREVRIHTYYAFSFKYTSYLKIKKKEVCIGCMHI